TDAVLLDPIAIAPHNRGILSWHKSPTTANPSEGIENVIKALLQNAEVDAQSIASVTIGTTVCANYFMYLITAEDNS
ncbi:hypothetical protein MPER_14142, partial [Moniliophthora perniciosa FA553]